MKTILCALCVLCGFQLGFALDRQAFTFTDYDLRIKITPATQTLEAEGKVTLRNDTEQPQRNPVLQISSALDWDAITVAGKPVQYLAQPYTSDIDHTGALSEAVITLPQPVPPQGTVEIEIAYEGKVLRDTTRLTDIGVPVGDAAKSDWDQISDLFTGVRGIGYVAWYPIATEAASLSDGISEVVMPWKQRQSHSRMRISLCWAGDSQLAANGQMTSAAMHPAGMNCRLLQYDPIGTAVPTFVLGPYRALNKPPMAIQYVAGHESYARACRKLGKRLRPSLPIGLGSASGRSKSSSCPIRTWLPLRPETYSSRRWSMETKRTSG